MGLNFQNPNKSSKGCLRYIIYFLIFCVILAIYSYAWILGIIALIYFCIKKSDPNIKKKQILISVIVIVTSFIVHIWLNSPSDLTSITADWGQDTFDINDTVQVKLSVSPSNAKIEKLNLSENNIAELNYKDGKAIITFNNEGTASLFFTANDSVDSNTVSITVIDKEAEEKRLEEQRIAEEKAKAESESEEKARKESEQKALEESQEKAKLESQKEAEESQPAPETEMTVYWTPSGKVYHSSPNCSTLSRSSNVLSGTISQSGKSRACEVCN